MSLRVEHLSVDIARRRIVTDISLAAGNRQFTGLLGPNGSGKSTILKTIYRVHKPAAGRIRLDGTDLLALCPGRRPAHRGGVAGIHQRVRLHRPGDGDDRPDAAQGVLRA